MSSFMKFVAILENDRHIGFSIGKSDRMDLTTIEMSHANFGACITMFTIHPKHANCLLYSKCYNMPQRRLAHEICNCRKILTSSDLYTMFGI